MAYAYNMNQPMIYGPSYHTMVPPQYYRSQREGEQQESQRMGSYGGSYEAVPGGEAPVPYMAYPGGQPPPYAGYPAPPGMPVVYAGGYASYGSASPSDHRPDDSPSESAASDYVKKRRSWVYPFIASSLLSILLYSIISGRISVLSHPLNYRGLACGWDAPVRHLPHVYYPLDPKDGKKPTLMPHRPMCVQRCPTEVDIEKKAYISVSEASAVSVGKSLALLSMLHSVKSPLYATESNVAGYCVPKAPALASQLEKILETGVQSQSWLRAVASALVTGVPASVIGAILAALISQISSCRVSVAPQSVAPQSYMGAVLILVIAGVYAAVGGGAWFQGFALLVAASCLGYFYAINARKVDSGVRLFEMIMPILKQNQPMLSILIFIQCVMLAVIYFVLIAVCFLQTSSHSDDGQPLEFALDPNGGLKIYPLERIATESARGFFTGTLQTISVVFLGVVMLETLSSFNNALTILTYFYRITSPLEDPQSGRRIVLPAGDVILKALSFAYMGLGNFWTHSLHRLIYRFLSPVYDMMGHYRLIWPWLLRIRAVGNSTAFSQYLLDLGLAEEDGAIVVDFECSVRTAHKKDQPTGETSWASWGPKTASFALLFTGCNFILRMLTHADQGISARTALITSMLLAMLLSYVANLGVNSAEALIEFAMYSADDERTACPETRDIQRAVLQFRMESNKLEYVPAMPAVDMPAM